MQPHTIHILGLGNLGKLLAHSLRKQHPSLPITLLFHRASLAEEWERAGRSIEIVRKGESDRQNGIDWEYVGSESEKSEIRNLILGTKTYGSVGALGPLRERLGRESTVLFLQNGIGTIDEVTTQLFPTPSTRPNYLAGIFNHGVYTTSPFSSVHAGIGNAVIGPVNSPILPSSTFLAEKISECPILSTTLVTADELLLAQFQKFAVNAVINPLSAIFACRNGVLFERPRIARLMDAVIREVSGVIVAWLQRNNPGVPTTKFEVESLKRNVYEVGEMVGENISSMRQDVLAGRKTEIDYINGWVVEKGAELGVRVGVNEKVVRLVKDGKEVDEDAIGELFGV